MIGDMATSDHINNDRPELSASKLRTLLKRARLQALLFTAGSIGTTLLTLGLLVDTKLPRAQGE
jgi:hypothetical protein